MSDPAFARVVCRAIGILVAYWNTQHLPPAHPYRQVAAMLRGYFAPLQRGDAHERAGEL